MPVRAALIETLRLARMVWALIAAGSDRPSHGASSSAVAFMVFLGTDSYGLVDVYHHSIRLYLAAHWDPPGAGAWLWLSPSGGGAAGNRRAYPLRWPWPI